MIVWQHHREHDHSGTEDCSAVELTEAIGRYPAGSILCDVLDDMAERMSQLELDYTHGFTAVPFAAFIAPYDPAGALSGVINFDSVILAAGSDDFGMDAVLQAPVVEEQLASFSLGSYFVELHNDAITVLVQPVDTVDTTIYVDSSVGFPAVPFMIQIGTETMTVTAVSGNEWTVVRDNPQSHPLGSYVVVC